VTGDPAEALADELAELDRLPAYLTREETWTFLRISEDALDRALERGELERRRIGGRVVIPRSGVRAWVVRQAQGDGDCPDNVVELPATLGVPKPERKE
jgi:Helix-turn-helix domain